MSDDKVIQEQESMEQKIEDLSIEDLSVEEIEAQSKALDKVVMEVRKERKRIRYILYRLKTEAASGGVNLAPDEATGSFKRIFIEQDLFEGWDKFSETWDVSLGNPEKIIHRDKSAADEWEELVRAKYPMIEPGGKVVYPDETVRKRILEEMEIQNGDSFLQQNRD
jgi:hypothetical protein